MKDNNTIDVSTHHINATKFNDRQSRYREHANYNKFVFSILSIIFLALLVVSIYRKSFTGEPLSFSSFLHWLSNSKSISINISISDFYIYGNWGIVDGLRSFFNVFAQLFGVTVFLASNLINLIIYLAQFISFLFS